MHSIFKQLKASLLDKSITNKSVCVYVCMHGPGIPYVMGDHFSFGPHRNKLINQIKIMFFIYLFCI